MNPFPADRIVMLNDAPIHTDANFVLYWMIAFRRAHWNFSLQRAIDWADELRKPLLILEALRCDYPWASERLHAFIVEGMRSNKSDFENMPAFYFPFVERLVGEGKGLVRELASKSCIVITDDYPSFFLPLMVRSVGKDLPVRMEAIDSNGLLPMRIADRVFLTAHSFRRYLQRRLPRNLDHFPKENPFWGISLPVLKRLPDEITSKWPAASRDILNNSPGWLDRLPIDHSVKPVCARGGSRAARAALDHFLEYNLHRYYSDRNHPDANATSGLSPYLHFGHISSHEIISRLIKVERWSNDRLSTKASGQREGWWGMSQGGEAFLDQLFTWRELGFNICSKRDDYDQFDSLPGWALETLSAHERDSRPYRYSLEEFESARTHDVVWNAAQRQLLLEGRIHNYLRMLWGKKFLSGRPLTAKLWKS